MTERPIPLNGRELVADDIRYCYEADAKEGVQSFTFQEIDGMETPDKYIIRIHLKTPNTMFPQNVAEAVTVIFPREVLEEDGDLKRRMIGTAEQVAEDLRAYEQVGVNHMVFGVRTTNGQEMLQLVERFAAEVRPLLQ